MISRRTACLLLLTALTHATLATRGQEPHSAGERMLAAVRLPALSREDPPGEVAAPRRERTGSVAGGESVARAAFHQSLVTQGWSLGVTTRVNGRLPLSVQIWRKSGEELLLTLQDDGPGRSRFLLAIGSPPDSGEPGGPAPPPARRPISSQVEFSVRNPIPPAIPEIPSP